MLENTVRIGKITGKYVEKERQGIGECSEKNNND